MQEDQSSVSEGVSSEGMFYYLLMHCCRFSVKIMFHYAYTYTSCVIMCSFMLTHTYDYNSPFQILINFWKIGQRHQTTALQQQFAAFHPPHPDRRRRNLPGNRTDHMTSFFHFEFEDKQEKQVDVKVNIHTPSY